jgi:prolyl-tRNA editing enzyme YbaK/EbsC (Cys-tRNA(Pro) deacylase)
MVLKVEKVLEDLEYRIIELKDRAITVEDVVRYSKEEINPEEICKTILVKTKGEFYALFLRGPDKIDFKKLKKVIGKASIASFDEVKEVTGVEPGAVCPLLVPVQVIVDEKVVGLNKLNFGSGNHFYGVEMRASDLQRVLDFKLVDISVD